MEENDVLGWLDILYLRVIAIPTYLKQLRCRLFIALTKIMQHRRVFCPSSQTLHYTNIILQH